MGDPSPNWDGDPQWNTVARSRPSPDPRPSVLLAVGPLLAREVDLDELLARIVDQVVGALAADRGTIYLVDGETGELVSRAAQLPEIKEIRLKPGQGIAGAVAASGQPLCLPHADGDGRFWGRIDELTGYRTRSVLAAPIADRGGRVLGVLQVLNSRHGNFRAEDEALARRLAAETALALESTSLVSELRRRERSGTPSPPRPRINHFVGDSPAMARVLTLVRKAAATDATVLVRGESGTGKELVARAIHWNGPRRDGPFVKVDCTTLPATLMENELFGHEKGAYTGADARAAGKCEAAEGGTLFIDEIGELPLPLQSKLLRFIQDHEFERVGGTRTLRADVRVVAATHRDLEAMVGRGEFREDLYYRVKVVQVALPPLRERGAEDIGKLAEHFLAVYARKHRKGELSVSPAARERLVAHRWPGNIRELEHCIESAVVLCEGTVVDAEHLALPAPVPVATRGTFTPRPLDDVEREHVLATLSAVEGNRSEAARLLGIGRNTLHRKLRGWGV